MAGALAWGEGVREHAHLSLCTLQSDGNPDNCFSLPHPARIYDLQA